ncbi:flagellar basal body rod protein FlgB [Myxococcota bacterium]|nr:flagellar basal body rod protein FlgB [Myxococcota bacterium]
MSGRMVLDDPATRALGRVLDLRAQQHATIVGNLAHADTPGFKARRLDFRDALAEVVSSLEKGPDGAPRPFGGFAAEARVDLQEAPPWSADGNSVNREQEAMLLNENNVMYGAAAELVRRRFASLEYAISGGHGGG